MRRREFIALMGASVAWPFAARAQQAMPTIGILTSTSPTTTFLRFVPVSLKGFGWEENRNYRTIYRFAEGHMDRMPALADELVAQRVDVIVVATEPGIQAAQRATKTIPIVGMAADLVRTGLAATMARPGGNLTGVNILANEVDVKRLEILHEAVPAARRIGALALPHVSYDTRPELEAAARQLDFELVLIAVSDVENLTEGLDALQSARVEAVNVLASPSVTLTRKRIIEGLNRAELPAIYEFSELAEEGGLLSYGVRLELAAEVAARLVSKILRGSRPEDLPIEQPTKFELVINLKTANAMGITVPPALLVRADKVIE
jgi:putative tryptophan/tyrosine transport system substrate-binding protein